MWYNDSWHSEISKTDVVERTWKDIRWNGGKAIQNMAINYLNQESIRKLPPQEFNTLVDKVKSYLHHVDHDRNAIEHRLKELKDWVTDETRTNTSALRDYYEKRIINSLNETKWPWDISRYFEGKLDNWMSKLEEFIWNDNIAKILILTSFWTAKEIWKWLPSTFKFWEEINITAEEFLKWSVSAWKKLILILKTVWIEWLRALSLIPQWMLSKWLSSSQILSSLWKALNKIKISNKWKIMLRPVLNERWSVVLRSWKEALKESEIVYSRYPFLNKYKEVLWEDLKMSDVVWEWTQAIILKHPTNKKLVLKIAKDWKVDDIVKEFENHNLFSSKILQGKEEWIIPDNIRTPHVYKWKDDWCFIMEKVDWQSLYTKTLLDYYKKQLDPKEFLRLNNVTDMEVREYLKSAFNVKDDHLSMILEDYSWGRLWELLWRGSDLSKAFDYLGKQWLYHWDLHPWNIMLDKKWNIYIIDFGRIKLFPKK
ncbi:MAG: hypothetical protein ACD_3C00086G0014 [uncultured bacterium (gcode 4)]|uniref:Protein kinase domain-containing protein n=1 Tax=uncultured bacterium (gcode 4) TaxID=1234023 RepID=K2GXN6_9BACT|nr:MAG: hypothetical protein ACD_3C00086G0014 [uncultured bacterium (gcode 4)]